MMRFVPHRILRARFFTERGPRPVFLYVQRFHLYALEGTHSVPYLVWLSSSMAQANFHER